MFRKLAIILVASLLVLPAGAKERTWTSADGRKMQAEFVREVDGVVTFLKEGKLVTIPLEKLSEQDQKIIRDYLVLGKAPPDESDTPSSTPAAASPFDSGDSAATKTEDKPAAPKITIEVRTWTMQGGIKTNAKFIRINGTDVILNRAGKILTIPYYSLNEDDQQYVRDLLTQQGKEELIPAARGPSETASDGSGPPAGVRSGPAGPVTSGIPTSPFPPAGGRGPGGMGPGGMGPGGMGPGGRGPGGMGPGMGSNPGAPSGVGPGPGMPAGGGLGGGPGFPGGGFPGGSIPGPGEVAGTGGIPVPMGIPPVGGMPVPGIDPADLTGPGMSAGPPGMSGGMPPMGSGFGPGQRFGGGSSIPTSIPDARFPGPLANPGIPTGPMFEQVYSCSNCKREISQEQSKLDRCPYCKTIWVYKDDGSGNKQMTAGGVRNLAIGIFVGIVVVVLGGVAGFIGIIVAIVRAVSRPARPNYRRY